MQTPQTWLLPVVVICSCVLVLSCVVIVGIVIVKRSHDLSKFIRSILMCVYVLVKKITIFDYRISHKEPESKVYYDMCNVTCFSLESEMLTFMKRDDTETGLCIRRHVQVPLLLIPLLWE